MTVAAIYDSMLDLRPELTRILGGMTAIAGMVMLFEHEEGAHMVHYYCDKTDQRQRETHRAAVLDGYTLLGTISLKGYEYMPENGGERFADIYCRAEVAQS
ncbi:hypothetical protein GCM10020221_11420 [Streptomyces thioluteus]|uniref:Uncharacterized protein n=1 Tax=Streptomyces thioluteus TaxID=66431 RepID=A0ABP6J1A8_STRTU